MTQDFVQVKGDIPRNLKRVAFALFALHDDKFNRWLQRALEEFVQENADLAEHLRTMADFEKDDVEACS
jgi:hypothetical protein